MKKIIALGLCLALGGVVGCSPLEKFKQQHITMYGTTLDDYSQIELRLLELLAQNNDALAQTELGLRNLLGIRGVVEKKPKIGMMWLEKAAASNEPEAIYQLSELYITPTLSGLEQHNKRSKQLLYKAAEMNHATAQMVLGVRLNTGVYGLDQNPKEAVHWLERAVNNGHKGARVILENLSAMAN